MEEQIMLFILGGWGVCALVWLLFVRKKNYNYYSVTIWKQEVFDGIASGSEKQIHGLEKKRLRLCPDGTWQILLRRWVVSRFVRFFFNDSGLVYRDVWVPLPAENVATVWKSILAEKLILVNYQESTFSIDSLIELSKKQIKKFRTKKTHYSFNE